MKIEDILVGAFIAGLAYADYEIAKTAPFLSQGDALFRVVLLINLSLIIGLYLLFFKRA